MDIVRYNNFQKNSSHLHIHLRLCLRLPLRLLFHSSGSTINKVVSYFDLPGWHSKILTLTSTNSLVSSQIHVCHSRRNPDDLQNSGDGVSRVKDSPENEKPFSWPSTLCISERLRAARSWRIGRPCAESYTSILCLPQSHSANRWALIRPVAVKI